MDANNVADQLREHAKQAEGTAQDLANKAQQATEKVKGTGRVLASKAADASRRAGGAVKDAGAAADLYLHEYAWTTVLMVALVAGTVGFMLGRRA